jgi:hypothetical protein
MTCKAAGIGKVRNAHGEYLHGNFWDKVTWKTTKEVGV